MINRPVEYLITYQNNGIHVLPKKHPQAKRRKSIPVPCELVLLFKDQISPELLPNAIKLIYLFKVPRPSVILAIEYYKMLLTIPATDNERIMSAILIAHKVNHDLIIKNSMWSKYSDIDTKRLTQLERQLLLKLNYSVFLTGY